MKTVGIARPNSRQARRATWRRFQGVLVALALLGGFLAFGEPAGAVHDTDAFELDGNAVNEADAGDDWANVCHEVTITNDPTNAIPNECAGATDTDGATAVSWASDGALNATIFTGGGSKDPHDISDWLWKNEAGGLPDKSNLLHSFAARYSLTPGTNCPSGGSPTCEVLYFGSDRYDNSGDAQQGFWFLQDEITLGGAAGGGGTGFTGLHTVGDLLVISDFSNGGTVSTITVYQWDPTCLKAGGSCGDANLRTLETSDSAKCSTVSDGDGFCGLVNPTNGTVAPWSFTDKSGLSTYLNGEFYEGGINLSLLNLDDLCFASVVSETRTSTSPTAVLKDFVLGGFGQCESGLVTTPKTGTGGTITGGPIAGGLSIGTGSVTAKDSAVLTVTGVSTWSGNLDFYLCGPITTGTCTTGGTKIGATIPVTQGTAQPILSHAATITSAGRYCWRGDFTAITNGVPNASDSSLTECFTVNPVTAALDTLAVASPVAFGQPAQDNATLSNTATQPGTNGPNTSYPTINATNGAQAGGKITFTLVKANCTTLATGTGTNPQDVTVSGNATYGPVSFTPDAPGTYNWKAQYFPVATDPNNVGNTHNASCADTDEQVVVSPIQPTISTRQFIFPQDKTTIVAAAGGGNLAGNVTFKLYNSAANCALNGDTVGSGGLLYKEGPLTISGASPQSATTNNTTVRVSSDTTGVVWRVTYASTNPAHNGVVSVCAESTAVTYTGNDGTIDIP